MIRAFDRLIDSDEGELNMHLPRLLSEAYESVELLDQKVSSTSASFQRHGGSSSIGGNATGGSTTKTTGEDKRDDDQEDDDDVVERYIYRKSITLLRGDPSINPNVDSDLMLPCLLPKKELPAVSLPHLAAASAPLALPRIKGVNNNADTTIKSTFMLKKHLSGRPKKLQYSLTQR